MFILDFIGNFYLNKTKRLYFWSNSRHSQKWISLKRSLNWLSCYEHVLHCNYICIIQILLWKTFRNKQNYNNNVLLCKPHIKGSLLHVHQGVLGKMSKPPLIYSINDLLGQRWKLYILKVIVLYDFIIHVTLLSKKIKDG